MDAVSGEEFCALRSCFGGDGDRLQGFAGEVDPAVAVLANAGAESSVDRAGGCPTGARARIIL